MGWKNQCRVTVLRRELYPDLVAEYAANPQVGKCTRFEDGQEFIIDKDSYLGMLNGQFCSEAWQSISHYIYAALQGGSIMHGWMKDEAVMIATCSDGVRPVIFKIERLDGEAAQ